MALLMTRRGWAVIAAVAVVWLAAPPMSARQQTGQARPPVFRSATNLVRVDVVVRDKDGKVVRNLKADDFVVQEDGKAQQVTSFDFEEIATESLPPMTAEPALLGLDQLQAAAQQRMVVTVAKPPSATAASGAAAPPSRAPVENATREDLPGRRLIVLLFDTSSMQPEEVDRAVHSANDYIDTQMSVADLVAVASVGQTLTILRDFTSDRDALKTTLGAFDSTSGTGFEQPAGVDATDVSDDVGATDETDPADLPLDDAEFGIFNNDRRLRAMRVLCEALAPIEQKKAILYFSSGMSRSGSDNQVELRAVINAANKSNTSIYPIDSRGLTAVVPGGGFGGGRGGGGRGGGSSVFSGRSMLSQFSSLNASQETLTTLAADTGGQVFLDSNDFSPAFTRVQRDMSAYYLLGYSSSNGNLDGKYRRIAVKLKSNPNGYKLEARAGYYSNTDFAHLAKADREKQLQEEIAAAVSSTDLPVVASTSWFRIATDKFYVPVSLAVPGSAVRVPTAPNQDRKNASIDLLGVVTDEQGRAVGRIRDTMQIPANQTADLANKQLQYQSGVTLPSGHFKVKVAVRENADGTMGTFEFPISIPDLKTEPMKVSPVVLRYAASLHARGRTGRPRGTRRPWRRSGRIARRIRRPRVQQPARRRRSDVGRRQRQPAAARRTGNRPEPDARRHDGADDVLLLRGVRPRPRPGGRPEAPHQPGLLSGTRESVRDARHREDGDGRPGSARGRLPTGTSRRRFQAGPLHLPGECHRRSRRQVRVPAARPVRKVVAMIAG